MISFYEANTRINTMTQLYGQHLEKNSFTSTDIDITLSC